MLEGTGPVCPQSEVPASDSKLHVDIPKWRGVGDTGRSFVTAVNIQSRSEDDRQDGYTGGRPMDGFAMATNRAGAKSVDFSVPVGVDEVDAELEACVNASNNGDLFYRHDYGRGAATNTPVTVVTDYTESQIQGRGLTTMSNELIYQHALTIMKNRCRSSGTVATSTHSRTKTSIVEENGTVFPVVSLPAVLTEADDHSVEHGPNSFFYITQTRQQPIAPIKAWKGYHGNVYFQPMICKKADIAQPPTPRKNIVSAPTRTIHSAQTNKNLDGESPMLPVLTQASQPDSRGCNPNTSIRSHSLRKTFGVMSQQKRDTASLRVNPPRQHAVFDPQFDPRGMPEDGRWIHGLEAMGTLHVGGQRHIRSTAHFYANRGKHHKLRIQRGLVSHQPLAGGRDQSLPALLGVHGGNLNDGADSVAKTKHLETQYRPCALSSPNPYGSYTGPFGSVEQLRRDSTCTSSPVLLGQDNGSHASPSSSAHILLKDKTLRSLASAYKNPVPLCSSKEVLFRDRQAIFLTRSNLK